MKFIHQCPDWDFMQIDESMIECLCCLCDLGPDYAHVREEMGESEYPIDDFIYADEEYLYVD